VKVLTDIPFDGSPGTLKPLVQSLVVVALVWVEFGDQTKLLLFDCRATASAVPKIPEVPAIVKLVADPLRGYAASPARETETELPVPEPTSVILPRNSKYLVVPAGTTIASDEEARLDTGPKKNTTSVEDALDVPDVPVAQLVLVSKVD
jgi:hypothetical protein